MDALKERAIFATALVEVLRLLAQATYRTDQVGRVVQSILVEIAIMVGQAEGRPATATDIAAYIGLPRPTVVRIIKELHQHRDIETTRRGNRVCYTFRDANSPDRVAAIGRIMRQSKAAYVEVSKLDTPPKPRTVW